MKTIAVLILCLLCASPVFSQTAHIDTTFAQEGTLKWKYTTTDFSSIPPLMAPDGTIYLSDIFYADIPFYENVECTSFIALSPDGVLKWKYNIIATNMYKILAVDADGKIYFTSYSIFGHAQDHYLTSLKSVGTEDKDYPIVVDSGAFGDNKYFTFKSTYSPTAYFYILNPDGNLTTLDISAGQPFISTDGFVYFWDFKNLNRMDSDGNIQVIIPNVSTGVRKLLAIGKENILYSQVNSTFRAIEPDGTLIWEYPGAGDCIVDNEGDVYASGNYLYAINSDGTLKWKFREESANKQEIKSPCIGSDGVIYFVDIIYGESYVYALNPDGTFRWKFHTDHNIPDNFYMMLHKNGVLCVADSSGTLYAIQTSSYGYQKGSPWPCYGHDNGHTFNAGTVYTSVEENQKQENTPDKLSLVRNYPNPFNSSTTISFNINKPGKVEISVYNLQGQKIITLNDSYLQTGTHSIVWDAEGCSSGLYFLQMKFGSKYSTLRAMLVK